MTEYRISEIAETLGKPLIRKDCIIRYLLTDSRKIISPADSLFFAIEGQRHDGHSFIGELYGKGVRSFVVSEEKGYSTGYSDANFIYSGNVLNSLQSLAAFHRKKFNFPVVGITGSNGKTIVKEWTYHCLSVTKNIVRSPKSYNSQVGVPLSAWLIQPGNDFGIFEAGISKPGEMKNLERIIAPEIGIFTNIGEAHQENFRDIPHKIIEKLNLFAYSNTLIYCKDHKHLDHAILTDSSINQAKLFTWSFRSGGDVNITALSKSANQTTIEITCDSTTHSFTVPFADDASIENAMHVVTLLIFLGEYNEQTQGQLATLPSVAMRLELKRGINTCTIINDSYNSDINSLSIAIDLLNMQVQHPVKTLILSDIYQSGMQEEALYTRIARLLGAKNIDRLVGIGGAISANRQFFGPNAAFFASTEEFLIHLPEMEFANEAILIKGSRKFEFEKISAVFEEKKHLTRLEINLNALIDNLNFYRSLLQEKTKIMVMVKALSYGSGSYEIANMLQYQRVDYLGVAFADEGVELRNAGITLPIMVMNADPDSYDTMIRHRLEPELYSFTTLELFNFAAVRNQESQYPVHIKLDTGMHRLGFAEEDTDRLCNVLEHTKNVNVSSVFSHLAASDEPEHDEFTREQIRKFTATSEKIAKAIGYPFDRHILNSSGIDRFPSAQFEMVRLGIGLYGFSAINSAKLKNISSLKSTISQVKKVHEGETIGYGRAGKTKKEMIIGTIPVGYADGINRKLGNGKGKMLIRGKLVPIVGNICMDMCMIDVAGTDAHEGDEVTIFGDGYPMTELARQLGTIPYEILTGISVRVKRIYYHE